jgi:hypothetical protein
VDFSGWTRCSLEGLNLLLLYSSRSLFPGTVQYAFQSIAATYGEIRNILNEGYVILNATFNLRHHGLTFSFPLDNADDFLFIGCEVFRHEATNVLWTGQQLQAPQQCLLRISLQSGRRSSWPSFLRRTIHDSGMRTATTL